MKVYVAILADDRSSLDEILVADSLDGIKNKCEKYCRENMYDELVDTQTEVSISNRLIFVHITGKDPEELYICTDEGILDDTVMFLMRKKETE